MKALFTTDGSQDATTAMRAGCRLLTSTDRAVDVLHVVRELRAPKSGRIARREYQHRQAEETKRILEEAKLVLAEEGVDALTLCQGGSPANVIMREAPEYDVVVIGAKGKNAPPGVGLGPVASRLIEHATGCVLVGRQPPGDRQARILVPLDGSDGSKQALDALISLFDVGSAEIKLLHVMETLWLPEDEDAESRMRNDMDTGQTDQLALELRQEAEQLLLDARVRILPHHPGVTTSIREGIPANEILSEADQGDYDLIVIGATGATDMKHSVLGSVSSKVAWNAPCSVLVVRLPE